MLVSHLCPVMHWVFLNVLPPAVPGAFQLTCCWEGFWFASWKGGENRREEPQCWTPKWGGHSLLWTTGTSSSLETERIMLEPDWEKLQHLGSLCPAMKALTWDRVSSQQRINSFSGEDLRMSHFILVQNKNSCWNLTFFFFLDFHQPYLRSRRRSSSLLRINSMCEGCPLSQWV